MSDNMEKLAVAIRACTRAILSATEQLNRNNASTVDATSTLHEARTDLRRLTDELIRRSGH